MIHCLIFDDPDVKTIEKWSGIFPTPAYLSEYIEKLKHYNKLNEQIDDINTIAYLNGVIYGLLHYGSKQTAQDIEIVLGKSSNRDKYNVFFYDFDKSSKIDNFDKENIGKLAESLSGSYSKFLGDIGNHFKEGYRFSAEIFELMEPCNKVIEKAEALEHMLLDDSDDELGGGGGINNKTRKNIKNIKNKRNKRKNKTRKNKTRKNNGIKSKNKRMFNSKRYKNKK